jgi:hypothetical protein
MRKIKRIRRRKRRRRISLRELIYLLEEKSIARSDRVTLNGIIYTLVNNIF